MYNKIVQTYKIEVIMSHSISSASSPYAFSPDILTRVKDLIREVESKQLIQGSSASEYFRFSLAYPASSDSERISEGEIAEILQSEAGFTLFTDRKPILATYGCGPCIALAGFDPTNKMAFVAHFPTSKTVRKSGYLIFDGISRLARQKIETPIQLHLRGGVKGGESEATIDAIKEWTRQRKDLPMKIASEDTLKSEIKSLSIDSRDGTVSEYDPKNNPGARNIDTMAVLTNGLEGNIHVAYAPKLDV